MGAVGLTGGFYQEKEQKLTIEANVLKNNYHQTNIACNEN